MPADPVVLESLTYAYPDGQAALKGVDLSVGSGEAIGLLGPNGAGKSTLLLHVNGLFRGQGVVRVGDLVVEDRTLAAIRSRVGLVFQNPDDQLFMPTVFEDVAFGPRNQGMPADDVERRVRAALEATGMSGYESRPPHHLSLGQKKRVALATVMVTDCSVLVLDEPTSGLDPRGRRELSRFLAGLEQTRIIATHDLEFAVELCDRVAVISDGRIVAVGAPRDVMSDSELMESTGLEVPHSLRYHAGGIPHRHDASI